MSLLLVLTIRGTLDLMRFLFKLDASIEVNIRSVILNDEDSEYTTTGIYFGSEAILRIRNMLEQ